MSHFKIKLSKAVIRKRVAKKVAQRLVNTPANTLNISVAQMEAAVCRYMRDKARD